MQKKKSIPKKRRPWAGILAAALFIGMTGGFIDYLSPSINLEPELLLPPREEKEVSAVPAPAVSAAGAVLMDSCTGELLYEKEPDAKLYPASTTKIMTALVVLEILEDLELDLSAEVIVPQEAAGVEGSSLYLKAGEKLTLEELLYGLMLQSGNDAAETLAMTVGGDHDRFVERMNARAQELECRGTHFSNPHGLFDENHYTTARDLALITQQAMKNQDFRTIVGSREWVSSSSGRSLKNKNKTVHQYDGATGVKIGFTKASGRTLVASATRGDVSLIAVVLKDGSWFSDAYELMDYGFALKGE